MHLIFYSIVVIFATCCSSQKEHLVPKHGIEPKEDGAKGLSADDVGVILKTLSKLERDDAELKYDEPDKASYPGEKLSIEKVRISKAPADEEKSSKITGVAEEDRFSDKDVSLIESLHHMRIAADIETYPYHKMASMMELPEKSVEEDKFHMAKDHLADESYLKKVDEIGTSISKEALATHLVDDNIEGHLKKSILEEKSLDFDPKVSHLDGPYKLDQDKEVDWKASHGDLFEIQGGIFPEEGYKIEASHHLEGSLAHEIGEDHVKMMKASPALDKELKMDHAHVAEGSIAHEMNDGYGKKLKESFALDKDLMMEGSHIAESGMTHKIDDELLKKLKGLSGLDEELKITGAHFEKSGIAHEIDEELLKKIKASLEKGSMEGGKAHELTEELFKKIKSSPVLSKEFFSGGVDYAKEGIGYSIDDELVKKMKSLGFDKELGIEGVHHLEEGITHDLNDEFVKKLKASHEFDEKFSLEKAHAAGDGIAHEMNEELMKKFKTHAGLDKEFKSEGAHYLGSGIAHDIDGGLVKKKETLGYDKPRDELFQISKELHKEESKLEGTSAYEKAIQQAHKDAHAHLGEEELKKHLDEALGFGIKEASHGKDLMFEKGLTAEKAHEISTKIGSGFDKSFEYGKEKAVFGSKLPVEGEIKHTIGHGVHAAEADKAFKFHEDELLKKEKAYEAGSHVFAPEADKNFKIHEDKHGYAFEESMGFEKEKAIYGSKVPLEEGIKHAAGHDIFATEADKTFKIHEDKHAHAFDEAVGFGKEKAIYGSKLPVEGGIKHGVGHDIYAAEADKAFKVHEDKHAHAFDETLGFGKEKAAFGSKEGAKHAVGHDIYAAEADKAFKVHEDKHAYAFDETLGFGKEKAAFGSKEGAKHSVGHDIYAAEADKNFKIHEDKHVRGFDEAMGFGKEKAVLGSKEVVRHAMDHDIYGAEVDKAFKFHEDELLKKEKAYEAGSRAHKDKEILDSAAKHHIFEGESTHGLHGPAVEKHHVESGKEQKDLKTKLIELLRRVLHIRKCHLVTMRPGELLGIVRCISSKKDPRLCEKFAACEKKMPLRVKTATEKCLKEIVPGGAKKCTREAPLYSSPEIPLKIFQCVAINVRELIPQEKKEMTDFEECARYVKAESCGRLPWFRGPH